MPESWEYWKQFGWSNKDYYAVLGVPPTASDAEVKRAFRRASLRTHPDTGGSSEEFKRVSEAGEILTDPRKRRSYDAWYTRHFKREAGPRVSFSSTVARDIPLRTPQMWKGSMQSRSVRENLLRRDINEMIDSYWSERARAAGMVLSPPAAAPEPPPEPEPAAATFTAADLAVIYDRINSGVGLADLPDGRTVDLSCFPEDITDGSIIDLKIINPDGTISYQRLRVVMEPEEVIKWQSMRTAPPPEPEPPPPEPPPEPEPEPEPPREDLSVHLPYPLGKPVIPQEDWDSYEPPPFRPVQAKVEVSQDTPLQGRRTIHIGRKVDTTPPSARKVIERWLNH